jgi:SAM-dependent methyltransferase
MTITMSDPQLFPDDTARLPTPGSPEQAELIADEEQIAADAYLETIKSIDELADRIYPEVARHCKSALDVVGRTRDLRVLDLGCGIALEIHALLKTDITVAELTLSDYSAATLQRAAALLADRPEATRVQTVELRPLDLLDPDALRGLAPGYDLVVTCNAFMHFPREDHRRLFAEIHRLLRDGGVFLFQSHFKTHEPGWKRAIIEGMRRRMVEQGAAPATIEQADRHITRFHQFHDLYRAYDWLEAAGFGFFDCVFRQRFLAMLLAVK